MFLIQDRMELFGAEITVLSVLSVTALVTTISLFFCGIPICLNIRRRKSATDISPAPFLMGLLGASLWLRYGALKGDITIIAVNAVGASLMFCYNIFYFFYCEKKKWITLKILSVLAAIGIMLVLVQIFGQASFNYLGFTAMFINIINFGAPLAGLRVVLRQRCCATLPFPLCVANLLVSSQWCLYGVLVRDIYLIIPNGIGIVLALVQLSLFIIFPWKEPVAETPGVRPADPEQGEHLIPAYENKYEHEEEKRKLSDSQHSDQPENSNSNDGRENLIHSPGQSTPY